MANYDLTTLEYIAFLIPTIMLLVWSVLEIITMLFDFKTRAVYNYIGHTVVIRGQH
jgi:hypothetical protein